MSAVHYSERVEFNPVRLRSPYIAPKIPYGPPVYTRSAKVRALINNVAAKHGITHDELMSCRRFPRCAWPRQEVYFVLHRVWGLSLPQAGLIMGRHHTTILDGLRKYEARNALR